MSEAAKTDGIFNLTVPVVMTFPQLFDAKAFTKNGKAQGEPKYSANFEFPIASEDLKAIKALMGKMARSKWPDKPLTELCFPLANGDKLADARKEKGKDDGEHMRGKVVISARSKYEPRLAYLDGGKIVDLDNVTAKAAAKNKFYPGVEVLAQFNLVPYDAVGQNSRGGVTAYLNMVLSTGKGARLSGGQTASEAFKGYVGSVSAENPEAPGSEEIPF